jgi:hypothetical protein
MSLDAVEFLRRFLLHVLPTVLVRVRQFGFLANRVRKSKLERCRVCSPLAYPRLVPAIRVVKSPRTRSVARFAYSAAY